MKQRLRDSQRSRVYKAEQVLESLSERLETVPEIEKYVRYVWSLKRVRDAFPAGTLYGPPKVRDGRGRRRAAGNAHSIWMPKWARSQWVTIHELAHTIQWRTYGPWMTAGHGWEFCHIYLHLVLYVMGREAHDKLKAAFKAHRIKYRQPTRRAPLSLERRQALTEQLAIAREARKQKLPR